MVVYPFHDGSIVIFPHARQALHISHLNRDESWHPWHKKCVLRPQEADRGATNGLIWHMP